MEIKEIIKEFRQEMQIIYGTRLVSTILYGSWARQSANDGSDIDLLLVLKDEVIPGREIDRIIDAVTEINLKYGVLLSVHPCSETEFATANSPLLLNVRREGVAA